MPTKPTSSPSSSTESFKSFSSASSPSPLPPEAQASPSQRHNRNTPTTTTDSEPTTTIERFPPAEEASLLAESNSLKGAGNTLFGTGSYENAQQTYDRALASCPNYLDYEVAVLRSNVAACCLKLEEWREAGESASKGVECLERLEPLPRVKERERDEGGKGGGGDGKEEGGDGNGVVEEVDDELATRIQTLQQSGHTLDSVRKLQIKLLLRRAKARSSPTPPTWTDLQAADEDHKTLLSPSMLPFLSPTDRTQTLEAARRLAPKLNAAKEREMAEMMGKLKGLGNSILKPFGLSTENFQFVKDEGSGGYSMNFQQNPGGKS